MFQVGDLRAKLWISLSLDFAERVGDILSIKKTEIPDLDQETPIPFERVTQKEEVIAKTFLSSETVELLKAYLPTLKTENPYLFPSNGNTLNEQAINYMLRNLTQ
jgi:integrase